MQEKLENMFSLSYLNPGFKCLLESQDLLKICISWTYFMMEMITSVACVLFIYYAKEKWFVVIWVHLDLQTWSNYVFFHLQILSIHKDNSQYTQLFHNYKMGDCSQLRSINPSV